MNKKICMLIGANSEIGIHIAKAMSQQYQLILVWHNNREKIDSNINTLFYADIIQKDMTDECAVQALFQYAYKKYSKVDFVINCIGKNIRQSDESIHSESWDDVLSNNLKPVLFIGRYYSKYIGKADHGCLINFSSTAGIRGIPKSPHYIVAKAGVIALSEYYAKILSPYIRVNTIAPGFVNTKSHISDAYNSVRELTPLKRMATMDEIVATVNYLIECNFITGQTIVVDGGLTL